MDYIRKEIEMISYCPTKGYPQPIRFKIDDEDQSKMVVTIDQILHVEEKKEFESLLILYDCRGVVKNRSWLFQLAYNTKKYRWLLYRF